MSTDYFTVKYQGKPLSGQIYFREDSGGTFEAIGNFYPSTRQSVEISTEEDDPLKIVGLLIWDTTRPVTDDTRILLCETLKTVMKRTHHRNDSALFADISEDDKEFYKDLGFIEHPTKGFIMFDTFGGILDMCKNRVYGPHEELIARRVSNWVKSGAKQDQNAIKATWDQYCGEKGSRYMDEYNLPELRGLAKSLGIKNFSKMRKAELCRRIATFVTIMEKTGAHPLNLVPLELV